MPTAGCWHVERCRPQGPGAAALRGQTAPCSANSEASIGGTPTSGYFIGSNPYTVCVYLANPMVASGSVDSASPSGTTVALPTGLSGQFRIAVSGEWLNTPFGLVDAQYNNGANGTTDPTYASASPPRTQSRRS